VDKVKFLDLGNQPIANGFLTADQFDNEFFYNLSAGFDRESCLVSHMDFVEPDLMFNDSYAYRGSMSHTMRVHFTEATEILKRFLPSKPKVLEIGSNDGVFIKNWRTETTFAVEPCGNFAKETNDLGYKTYPNFWDENLSNKILEENGKMDLVFSANCMCHIPDIDSAFSAVHNILSDDGFFVFEDPSLEQMIDKCSYDQIYDEHPHIFSVIALKNILSRNGFSIVKIDALRVHGGSNRIWAKKTKSKFSEHHSVMRFLDWERSIGLDKESVFNQFAEKVHQSKTALVDLLTQLKNDNKKIISYGATSKSTTIFNYCNINTDLIEYITDTTPEKQDKFSPGVHIPIISPKVGFDNSVDFAFLGAWNFAQEIRQKENQFSGKFITHVPHVRLL
jgi:methylation protein EvaC